MRSILQAQKAAAEQQALLNQTRMAVTYAGQEPDFRALWENQVLGSLFERALKLMLAGYPK